MALQFLSLNSETTMTKTVELLKKHKAANVNESVFINFHEKTTKQLQSQDYINLISNTLSIMETSVADVKLLTPIYSSICYWISQIKGDQNKAVDLFYKHLEGLSADYENFKIRIAALLFNTIPSLPIFKRLIDISAKLGKLTLIINSIISDINKYFLQWKTNAKEERELLQFLIQNLQKQRKHQAEIIQIAFFLFSRFEESDTIESIIEIFAIFLNQNPNLNSLGRVVQTKAFSILKKRKHFISVFIENILNAEVAAITKIVQENNAEILKLNLQVDLGLEQARINKLVKLSESKNHFSYEQLAAEWEINEDQVERWIIKAIQSHTIKAKIDQNAKQIVIIDNSQKYFTSKDWFVIDQKLQKLKGYLTA